MMSHLKVMRIVQRYILRTFSEFLVVILSDLNINLIMPEPHHDKFFPQENPPNIDGHLQLKNFQI